MKHLAAFIMGMREFRLSFTTYYRDWRLALSYDCGREFMHFITLRRFDQ